MLGGPVAHRLLADGYKVRVLARNPETARAHFKGIFEIVKGDVRHPDTLHSGIAGCSGVHINLAGGPRPDDYDRIEHLGTANVADAAAKQGVERITYLSGTAVFEENCWFPGTLAKFQAEAAIRACGVSYSIFCASWFMESLPLFVKEKRASVIGDQPHPFHWIAAEDYARMVSRSFSLQEAANKRFFIHGPQPMTIPEALHKYCRIVYPGMKVSKVPIWLVSLMGTLTGKARMRAVSRLMAFFEKVGESGNPAEANEFLGTPTTTLEQWSKGHMNIS